MPICAIYIYIRNIEVFYTGYARANLISDKAWDIPNNDFMVNMYKKADVIW